MDPLIYTFSLSPNQKAPRNDDEALESTHLLLISSVGVYVVYEDEEFGYEYTMTKEARIKEMASLLLDLEGIEPKKTSSSSAKPSSGTTTKPTTSNKPATSAKPVSTTLIASPAQPKKMTEVQMVMNPFGVLTKNLSRYTYRQVVKDLKSLYNDYVDVWEEQSIISVLRENGKGYDMSYKGLIPTVNCIFHGDKLYSYQYEFYFDRDRNTKESVEAIAKGFVSALKKNGINLTKNLSGDSYSVSGRYAGRGIIVCVHDIEDEPYKIWINISNDSE